VLLYRLLAIILQIMAQPLEPKVGLLSAHFNNGMNRGSDSEIVMRLEKWRLHENSLKGRMERSLRREFNSRKNI
jgi:hypothetical protein